MTKITKGIVIAVPVLAVLGLGGGFLSLGMNAVPPVQSVVHKDFPAGRFAAADSTGSGAAAVAAPLAAAMPAPAPAPGAAPSAAPSAALSAAPAAGSGVSSVAPQKEAVPAH